MKGLILDSDPKRKTAMKGILADLGHEIIPVPSGADVRSVILESGPDVIAAAADTSALSCEDLCLYVKHTRRLNLTAVIVLTDECADRQEVLMKYLSAGADHVLFGVPEKAAAVPLIKKILKEKQSVRRIEWVGNWYEFDITNELKYIKSTNAFMESLFLNTGFSSQEIFNLTYVLRELMHNAFEHGNLQDANKKVRLSYVLFQDRLVIKIEDEGEGFDHRSLEDPLKDPLAFFKKRKQSGKRLGGLGIVTTKKIMDDVIFSEKGNVVLMTKYLKGRHGSA